MTERQDRVFIPSSPRVQNLPKLPLHPQRDVGVSRRSHTARLTTEPNQCATDSLWMSSPVFDVSKAPYHAKGNGSTDDTAALQSALNDAQAVDGCVYFPAGVYLITQPLSFRPPDSPGRRNIALRGDGPNVSVIKAGNGVDGLDFVFAQNGGAQPWGVAIMDLGFRSSGVAGTAIRVSYGSPAFTNEHRGPSVIIRNVSICSDETNWWSNGIDLTSAWNVRLTDCFISGGSFGGAWRKLSGRGIALHRSCVNAHFFNCHCNFWATAFHYDTGTEPHDHNTEGLFFSNCSFVAVLKGVHIVANPNYLIGDVPVPRVSGFIWQGGLVELRSAGTPAGSAAFHLVRVNEIMINGAMMLNDTIDLTSYAIFADTCSTMSVVGCNIYSYPYGVLTTGVGRAVVTSSCTFVNCHTQAVFSPDTVESRSFGHVRFNNSASEVDQNGSNKMGWV